MIEISTSRVGGTSSTSGSTSSAGTRTGNTSNTTASSRSVTVAKPKQAVAPVAIGKGGEPVKPRKRRRKLTEEPRDQAMRRFKCDTCGKAFARFVLLFLCFRFFFRGRNCADLVFLLGLRH